MTGSTLPPDPRTAPGRPSVRSGMQFAGASFAATVVLTLTSAVVTSRLYGVSVVGAFALAAGSYGVLMQVSNLNEHVALVQRLSTAAPRAPRTTGLFLAVLGFSSALSCGMAVIVGTLTVVVLRGPVDRPDLVPPALVLLAAYVLLENLNWNLDAVLAGFRAGRQLFVARLAQLLTALVSTAALAAVSRSVEALAASLVVSFAVGLLLRLVLVRPYVSLRSADLRHGRAELPSILRTGLHLVPGTIASGLVFQLGLYVLGATASAAVVGAYSRAAGLAVRLQDAGFRVAEILFPALVEHQAVGQRRELERTLSSTLRLTAAGLLLVSSVGSAVARPVLRVFGDGFAAGATTLGLLLFAQTCWVITYLQSQALIAQGRTRLTTAIVLVRSGLSALLLVPLAQTWGAEGVATSLLLPLAGEVLVRALWPGPVADALRGSQVRWSLLAVALACAAAHLAARSSVHLLGDVLGLPVGLVLGTAVGVMALVLLGGLTRQERARLRSRSPV